MIKISKKSAKKKVLIVWGIFLTTLATSLIAERFIHVKPVLDIEGRIFFHAWFGFITCIVFVLFSKILGFFIKRHESYYKENVKD